MDVSLSGVLYSAEVVAAHPLDVLQFSQPCQLGSGYSLTQYQKKVCATAADPDN